MTIITCWSIVRKIESFLLLTVCWFFKGVDYKFSLPIFFLYFCPMCSQFAPIGINLSQNSGKYETSWIGAEPGSAMAIVWLYLVHIAVYFGSRCWSPFLLFLKWTAIAGVNHWRFWLYYDFSSVQFIIRYLLSFWACYLLSSSNVVFLVKQIMAQIIMA